MVKLLKRRAPAAHGLRRGAMATFWILLATIVAPRADATPDARFVASKIQGTTCVAPCAVHFDAIGNGSDLTRDTSFPRAFHSLLFFWEFGDPGSGTWAVSGKSKDRAIGAIAGHLYANPGTYGVRLTVTNAYGESDTAEAQVVVTDPDAHFASTTWCFANSGSPGGAGFESCPTRTTSRHVVIGANVAAGFDLALGTGYCNASQAKNRCLFRAGDTFRSNGLLTLSQTGGPGLLTRFGEGSDPKIVGGDGFVSIRDGWTVADFDVELGTGNSLSFVQVNPQRRNVTAARLRARNLGGSCFTIQTGSVPTHNDLIAAIELDCVHVPPSVGTSIYLRAERTLVMGNSVDLNYLGEFTLRTVHFPHSLIEHNRFTRPNAGPVERNVMQLRAWTGNTSGGPANNGPAASPTEYVIVSDNDLSQDNASMVIRTCQTNTCGDAPDAQNMQHLIFERNFFQFTSQPGGDGPSLMPRVLWLEGGDITIRDNIFDLQGIKLGDGQNTDRLVQQGPNVPSSSGLNRDDVHVLNNVVYFDESINRPFRLCSSMSGGTGHRCQNNLVYVPNHRGSRQDTEGTGWLASNNVFTTTNPFVRAVPGQGASSPTDFQLNPAADIALDAGYDFGTEDTGVQLDFGTGCRPADGNADSVADIDIGAWERNADTVCLLAAPEPSAALTSLFAVVALARLRRRA